jgi:hypothetical protein
MAVGSTQGRGSGRACPGRFRLWSPAAAGGGRHHHGWSALAGACLPYMGTTRGRASRLHIGLPRPECMAAIPNQQWIAAAVVAFCPRHSHTNQGDPT